MKTINIALMQLNLKINENRKSEEKIDSPREKRKQFIKINNLLPKSQQRCWSEFHNVFNEEANKIANEC